MPSAVRLLIVPAAIACFTASAIGGITSPTSGKAPATDSTAVVKIVRDFHAALSAGDSTMVLILLAPDAMILESGGVESRSEYRSHHLPEDIKFAKRVATKTGPLEVRVEGSSAWTAMTSTTRGRFNGKAINSIGAESMVLTKQGGTWRIRSIHWSSRSSP